MKLFSFLKKIFGGEKSPASGEKVLVIGGSGYVGGLVLPYLSRRFQITVYDMLDIPDGPWTFRRGDVLDEAGLEDVCRGMDAMIYLALGKPDTEIIPGYDVNAKGLHLAFDAAVKAGIKRAVYASTLSVYEDMADFKTGGAADEETPVMPKNVYGLTKFLGEEICRFFSRRAALPVFVLRLFVPVPDNEKKNGGPDDLRVGAEDLARAFQAALLSDHQGFEIIHITGDKTGKIYGGAKAKRVLGWEPSF